MALEVFHKNTIMGCLRMRNFCFLWVVLVLSVAATLNQKPRLNNFFNFFDRKEMDDETDEWKEKYYEMEKRMIQIMTEISKETHALQLQRNKTFYSTKSLSELQKENKDLSEKVVKLMKKLEDHQCGKRRDKSKKD